MAPLPAVHKVIDLTLPILLLIVIDVISVIGVILFILLGRFIEFVNFTVMNQLIVPLTMMMARPLTRDITVNQNPPGAGIGYGAKVGVRQNTGNQNESDQIVNR